MKIQSNFKDVYDNLVADFQSDIIYKRYSSYLNIQTPKYFKSGSLDLNVYLLGFCGKCKIFLHKPAQPSSIPEFNKPNYNIWNIEHADKFLDYIIADKDKKEIYLNKNSGKRFSFYIDKSRFFRKKVEELLNKDFKSYDQYFEKAPIFLVCLTKEEYDCSINKEPYDLILNPKLANYDVFSWKNCYSFYQELNQYITNIAKPEPFVPIPDDITMRDIKGFDKYSFRKESSKKRIK